MQWYIASYWLRNHSWAKYPHSQRWIFYSLRKVTKFWIFYRNVIWYVVLIRTDNMLMICVLDDFNIFKHVEIWQWCLSDLRYEYVNMIWDMFWWFIACWGWDLNYANCEGENDMNMKACFEVCIDVVLWVLKWQIWINIDFNWVLLYTEFKI